MTQTEAWTIGKLLTWTTEYLSQHGSDSPRLDAEVLLAHVRSCQRIALYTSFDELAEQDVRDAFRDLVKQRAAGMPVAYLVGEKEFYSLPFKVTRDVLIPRPETEFLVVTLLDLAKQHSGLLEIVDVGTGSGVLAVCIAKHLATARVIATDTSAAALEVARGNAARHGVADRIEFLEGNLIEPVDAPVDVVVSNPPYVSRQEYQQLDPSVRQYEPESALVGGDRGDELIVQLIQQSKSKLKPGGWLMVELSPMLATRVIDHFGSAGLVDVQVVKDLAGLERVVMGRRPDSSTA